MQTKSIFLSLLLGSLPITLVTGQDQQQSAPDTPDIFTTAYHNIFLVLAVLVILGVILVSLKLIWALIDVQKLKVQNTFGPEARDYEETTTASSFWKTVSDRSWNLVPIDKEADIDLGHEYDGIRELDNSLPPWWLWLFYITIIWSAVYLWYYHVSDRGAGMEQEYIAAMQQGEKEKQQYLASQADAIDEKTVTLLHSADDLAEGREIYVANCQVCHGAAGEGGVGPNFTDRYWIHGGSIHNLFSTIKYGVPEKGMIAWKAQLRPAAIQKVASFILSLQDTNPPNQKAPQGDLYEENSADSTVATADTIVKVNSAEPR